MGKIVDPRDCLGNIIRKDEFYTVHFMTPPIGRIIAVENGGIHTANGMTPAFVRVIIDLSLRQMLGIPFLSLAKLQTPGSQALLEDIASHLPKD